MNTATLLNSTLEPAGAGIPRTLLSPLTIGSMTLRNRVVMPPMGTNFAAVTGEMTPRHLAYYRERAKGRTGLIIVENVCVQYPQGSNGFTQLRLDHDSFIPGLSVLTETLHRHGSRVAVQLNHAGASASAERTGMESVSSSDQPSKRGAGIPRALTHAEIATIVANFGKAARRAKAAGFDAVEVHAGHSYLLCQFLSPLYNRRDDAYGGSAENRARIVREVLAAVRAQVGADFPVLLRLSADELVQGGNTLEDTLALAAHFADGVDAFNVSAAVNDTLQYQIDKMSLRDGWRSYMARAFRERFGKPTITSGNIRDPQVAERILLEGDADLIAIGRGLIADPHWVRKVEQGRADEIIPCVSCNIGCADNRIRNGRPIHCTVNPEIVDSEGYRRRRVRRAVKVVVVGGGNAGMEAACTAAELGCEVVVMERERELGGMVRIAARLPAKDRMNHLIAYLGRRAQAAGVEVRFGTEASVDAVAAELPDIVVNATGAAPVLPPIAGLRERVDVAGSRVYSIVGMSREIASFGDSVVLGGQPVVVVGGGAVGLDVVEHVTELGARVTLVERLPKIANDLDLVTDLQMHEMLQQYGVDVLTRTALKEVRDGAVVVEGADGGERLLPSVATFICLGLRASNGLHGQLQERFAGTATRVYNIGDSVRARKIIDGIAEGRQIIGVLEEIDAL